MTYKDQKLQTILLWKIIYHLEKIIRNEFEPTKFAFQIFKTKIKRADYNSG